MKAAIYARVSTRDQTAENQLAEIRDYAAHAGYEVAAEFVDQESGARPDRPQLRAMLDAARRRRFDVLLFWSLDRLTRQGAGPTLELLAQLDSYGVRFRSHTEQYLDSCGMFRDAVIGILSTIAKQERHRISERTRAGMERAKRQGKQIGRPRCVVDAVRIREQLAAGRTWGDLARDHQCSESTLRRRVGSHIARNSERAHLAPPEIAIAADTAENDERIPRLEEAPPNMAMVD